MFDDELQTLCFKRWGFLLLWPLLSGLHRPCSVSIWSRFKGSLNNIKNTLETQSLLFGFSFPPQHLLFLHTENTEKSIRDQVRKCKWTTAAVTSRKASCRQTFQIFRETYKIIWKSCKPAISKAVWILIYNLWSV